MSGNEQQKYATGMHLKRYMGNQQKQKWLPKGKVYMSSRGNCTCTVVPNERNFKIDLSLLETIN